jgi:hypothetical protein
MFARVRPFDPMRPLTARGLAVKARSGRALAVFP